MPNVVGVNEGRFTLIMATSSYVTLELFFYRCHMSGATQRRPQPNLRMGTNCYICKTSTGRKSKLREREGLRYVDVVQSVVSFMLIWSDTHSMLIRFTYQNIYELSNKTWRSTLMNHQQNPYIFCWCFIIIFENQPFIILKATMIFSPHMKYIWPVVFPTHFNFQIYTNRCNRCSFDPR